MSDVTPERVVETASEPTPRLLHRDAIVEIARTIERTVEGGGETYLRISAWWRGSFRWARNRVTLASDRRDYSVSLVRRSAGGSVTKETNQIDGDILVRLIRDAEKELRITPKTLRAPAMALPRPDLPRVEPLIWSDTTYNVTAEQRAEIARQLTKDAEVAGMLSAGFLEMRAHEVMGFSIGTDDSVPDYPKSDSAERDRIEKIESTRPSQSDALQELIDGEAGEYIQHTEAQCSMTVRHPKGTGSGWAGLSSYDWSAINGPLLAERALDKCLASLNPVAIEPGRYTVILEPQAVATFSDILVGSLGRERAEAGRGPWALERDRTLRLGRTRLGLRVVDERLTIEHDPEDPQLGVVQTIGIKPEKWISSGVLNSLTYDRQYSLRNLNENVPSSRRAAYRMSGGDSTVEEMITSTTRGLFVTRFSDTTLLDEKSLVSTGLTRDGLWLIEHGAIAKAVRNMRFTESPLFVLNQIEQLGKPLPVFHPSYTYLAPVIVPPLKARDFAFTATITAI